MKYNGCTKLIALLPCSLVLSHEAGAQKKPNILFICTDDQAAWTVGASGNREAITPNLDRLAAQGVYLSNAMVTTPVSSPSRSSLFTGRYASETNIPDFIVAGGHTLFNEMKGQVGLDRTQTTFVELLRRSGYSTALVGKWHLGDWLKDPSRKFHPTNHGFEYFMGMTGGGTNPADARMEEDGALKTFSGFTDDVLTGKAIRYIREQRNSEKPFLLCLMYRAPHTPWKPVAKVDQEVYEGKKLSIPDLNYPDLDTTRVARMMRAYMTSVASVDRNVGDLLRELDRLGIEDNTIVIFTSDNGFTMGHNGIWHKGNGIWATLTPHPSTETIDGKYRPNLYDHSLRVPGIIRWPGSVAPGLRIDHIVSNLDWYPTLLQMAGVDTEVMPKEVRGRSLVPLLRGENAKGWNDDFYSEYSMINYCTALMRSYRTADWKLVRDYMNPDRDELYDLRNDPRESVNLIGSKDAAVKKVIAELDKKIQSRMKEIGDPLLDAVKKGDYAEYLNNIH